MGPSVIGVPAAALAANFIAGLCSPLLLADRGRRPLPLLLLGLRSVDFGSFDLLFSGL